MQYKCIFVKAGISTAPDRSLRAPKPHSWLPADPWFTVEAEPEKREPGDHEVSLRHCPELVPNRTRAAE